MAYTFKRVEEGCYKDLVFLYESAFKQSTSLAYYQNKFNTNYLGVKHLGYLAYDEKNKPAAFYGVFPYMMEYKGEKILGAQSGDTMTHPDHKGKGLFTALGKMTNELAKREGIKFMFGLPNKFSYHGLVKSLQWTHVDDMNNYRFKVFTLPLSAVAKKFSFLLPLYNRYVQFVLRKRKAGASFFKSSVITKEFGGVLRDDAFYNYKNFYNNHLIRIENRNAWIKIDGSLFIGDIEFKDDTDVNKLIGEIKKLACCLGCTDVLFPVTGNTNWDLILKPVAKQEKGLALCLLNLQSELPMNKFKFTAADFDTF